MRQKIIIILTVLFIILALFASRYPYFSIDLYFTHFLQQIHFRWFKDLMIFISELGMATWGTLIILLFVLIAVFYRKYKDAFFILFSAAGVSLIGFVVKILVDRPRPSLLLVSHFGPVFTDRSFPSGHVLYFVGLYGFILFLISIHFKKNIWRWPLYVAITLLLILIGVSRIYLGDHWFSDVVGGYLLGIIWVLISINVYKRNHIRFRG